MAHDCFEDATIAEIMNRAFVSIKIDREERPDLDFLYQFSLQAMNQAGGWPLTLFLTPEGKPFWGGTYFPRLPRDGYPGFADILTRIEHLWATDRPKILHQATDLATHVEHWLSPYSADTPRPADHARACEQTLQIATRSLLTVLDHEQGGLGGAPKFPQFKLLEFLGSVAPKQSTHKPSPDLSDPVQAFIDKTFERIGRGGLYDHLGGGIARYCVDRDWTTPHFEKMLYDNALYIEALTKRLATQGAIDHDSGKSDPDNAWKDTPAGFRLMHTVDWLLRELCLPGGGFAASLDADSEGQEGVYYTWTHDEITHAIGAQSDAFFSTYGLIPLVEPATHATDTGDQPIHAERYIIVQKNPLPRPYDTRDTLDSALMALRRARDLRPRPGRDPKLLADWNGLTISALTVAGLLTRNRPWIKESQRAFQAVRTNLTSSGPNGEWAHALGNPPNRHPALLDDLAAMARASLHLYQVDFDPDLIAFAESCFRLAETAYLDKDDEPYRLTSTAHPLPFATPKLALDNPAPSGNSLWLEVLMRLFLLTRNPHYRERHDQIVATFLTAAEKNPAAHGSFLVNLVTAPALVHVLFTGAKETLEFQGFRQQVFAATNLNAQMSHIATHETHGLPIPNPGAIQQIGGRPTAILTVNDQASEPFNDVVMVRQWLGKTVPRYQLTRTT